MHSTVGLKIKHWMVSVLISCFFSATLPALRSQPGYVSGFASEHTASTYVGAVASHCAPVPIEDSTLASARLQSLSDNVANNLFILDFSVLCIFSDTPNAHDFATTGSARAKSGQKYPDQSADFRCNLLDTGDGVRAGLEPATLTRGGAPLRPQIR